MTTELPKLEISYQVGEDFYTIYLHVASKDEIVRAVQEGRVEKALTGEALIMALRGKCAPGTFREIERFKNGLRNDGPEGEYAQELMDAAGAMLQTQRFQEGALQDALNGAPAVQYFNGQKRKRIGVEHQTSGTLHNGRDGSAAVQQNDSDGNPRFYAFYDHGRLMAEWTWYERVNSVHTIRLYDKKGELNDSREGVPAVRRYNEMGQLVLMESWKEGRMAKRFTQEEMRDYQNKAPVSEKAFQHGHPIAPENDPKLRKGAVVPDAIAQATGDRIHEVKKGQPPFRGPRA